MANYMQEGNAVMVTYKEDNNDGNIGVIHSCNGEFAEVHFNSFDGTHSYNVSSLIDLTFKAQNNE